MTVVMATALSSLKPYMVRYRGVGNSRIENCIYANDAYEARLLAMEFNKYIKDHPNCIDLILCVERSTNKVLSK